MEGYGARDCLDACNRSAWQADGRHTVLRAISEAFSKSPVTIGCFCDSRAIGKSSHRFTTRDSSSKSRSLFYFRNEPSYCGYFQKPTGRRNESGGVMCIEWLLCSAKFFVEPLYHYAFSHAHKNHIVCNGKKNRRSVGCKAVTTAKTGSVCLEPLLFGVSVTPFVTQEPPALCILQAKAMYSQSLRQ